jgi:hypothetical protein
LIANLDNGLKVAFTVSGQGGTIATIKKPSPGMANKNRRFQLNKNLQISDQIAKNIANDGTYYQ